MDESEDNMSSEEVKYSHNNSAVKVKPKKRSLVERELETNLTARVTSPVTHGEGSSTSRYGRARRLKTDTDFCDTEKAVSTALTLPKHDKTPVKGVAYKMHASNSPVSMDQTPKSISIDSNLDHQIENIYNANLSLSRFGSEEKKKISPSPAKKFPKVYVRTDLIQTKEKEETITLIRNMFSPTKTTYKPTNSHLSNILERSSEKYTLNGNVSPKPQNGYLDTSSVVKTLDFDGNKKKKKENRENKVLLSKSDLFDLEAKCEYQVGDLAWARMGTYPFWPCIVTREPVSDMFVKKKLFGRIERDVIHVTFFGDNGRRSWIVDTMLRKFLGRLEFEATKEQFTPEAKKKDPRLYAAFFISEKKQALWDTSVDEAETLLREPKRLRIDLLYDMLSKPKVPKVKGQKSEKITRTDSDVSLSESLYDTLFSEDDGKTDDADRSRNKRNKSLDVSEVVTACLDNMAAKTGITKIQRQSHMDRWLQKAKSKTPEKSQIKVTVTVEKVIESTENSKKKADSKKKKVKVTMGENLDVECDNANESNTKVEKNNEKPNESNTTIDMEQETKSSKKKKKPNNEVPKFKPYSFRKSTDFKNLSIDNDEHDSTTSNMGDMESCFVKLNKVDIDQQNIDSAVSENLPIPENNMCVMENNEIVCEKDSEKSTEENDLSSNEVFDNKMDASNQERDNNASRQALSINEKPAPETLKNGLDLNIEMEVDPPNSKNIPKDCVDNFNNLELNKSPSSVNFTEDTPKFLENEKEHVSIINGEDNNVSTRKYLEEKVSFKETVENNQNFIAQDTNQNNMQTDTEPSLVTENVDSHLSSKENTNTADSVGLNGVSEHKITNCESVSSLELDTILTKEDITHVSPIDTSKLNNLGSMDISVEEIDKETQNIEDNVQVKEINEEKSDKEQITGASECDTLEKHISINENTSNDKQKVERAEIADIEKSMSVEETLVNLKSVNTSQENNSHETESNCSASVDENFHESSCRTAEIVKDESDLDSASITSTVSELPAVQQEDSFDSVRPKVNGYVEYKIKEQINDVLLESDTASMSSELDDISLNELKQMSNSLGLVKESNVDLKRPLKVPKIVLVRSESSGSQTSLVASSSTDKTRISLSLKKSKSPSENVNQNGFHDSKESSPERKSNDEFDPETASINSEDSGVSLPKRRGRPKEKSVTKEQDRMQDPEFLRYLESRQDSLIDEHPELSHKEIVAYLYNTWLYEESLKSDIKKTDELEQSNLVKGVNKESAQPKKVKKNVKLINIDKVLSQEAKKSSDIIKKEKPKRKTVQPYYYEDYSDIEEEIQVFEIFKKKQVPKTTGDEKPNDDSNTKSPDSKSTSDVLKPENSDIVIEDDDYNDEEAYFEQLTKPKPNIFKGMVREKVCEICEKTNNLVKCKGCHGTFHVDCVKKETEIIDVPIPMRGRKKKKKPRGRKPKVSTDSNGVDSESHSEDPNVSEEQNISVDDIMEPEAHIVADAESFESQLAAKMKEILEATDNVEYDSYSSDDGLDWSDTVAGKCQIVDIKPKTKTRNNDYSDFKCNNCQKDDTPVCFVCKSPVSPKEQNQHRQKCQVAHCHKYYHLECLEIWPQTQFNSGEPSRNSKKIGEHFEAMSCPRHVCHTCVCDDPRGCKTRFSGDKLARCVRCPATYHSFTKCLPAGTQILTASHIICPRHYEHRPGKVPCHVNTGWCFICALGGSLICCEYCPTSFHAECLNIKPPEGGYMCEDCETGRLPLYGEMVWVKLGHYRWWPGIILHPSEIPANIMAVKHSPGEFVVRFFGQYDHYWVNRGRVFPFQEGDSGRISSQKSKIDEAFTKAMEHAQRAFEILKNSMPNQEESLDIAQSLLPPHYVKLKVNRPCGSLCGRRLDLEESSLTQCECDPDEEDPCGPYSHCLNRMLLTECGPTCRAGERCSNRAFEKRLYPKLVPYRTPHRGWGLKTLEDIKAGQFVIEYVGELIDEEEFKRRMRRKHEIRDENFYFLTLDKERMIDAGPKGNLARFMNHCCEPNCETQKWTVLGDVRVGLFAIHDIPANSEVTFNYNLECAGIEKKRCLCGAKRCSGYIGAKPKQDEPQVKKAKPTAKRTYKKRKQEDSPSTNKFKPKRPVGRPSKPRELTEIEKDLLIIKNATTGISSDSECSGRLSSVDVDEKKDTKALKRKRVSFSTEEIIIYDGSSPSVKKIKLDDSKTVSEVGD